MSELLRVENLHVAVGGKTLLHGINLTVNTGEVHVIMGVNGAGKSTLLHAIMGNPAYEITEGHVYFEGEDITELSTDKRARLGIFLSFQNPVSIAGGKALLDAVEPDGKLGYVQPIGADPRKVTRDMTEVYGTGAFLLSGCQIYKMK